MSSLRALPFSRNQRRSFTLRTQITSTTPAMGRKKVIGHTDVVGMVPLSASLSCGRYPRTALWIHFRNVFQQVTLSLLLVLKEDPPSSLLEEKNACLLLTHCFICKWKSQRRLLVYPAAECVCNDCICCHRNWNITDKLHTPNRLKLT